MRGERLDAIERRRLRDRGLQRQPFVDDQRIVGIARVEIVERGGLRSGTSQSDSVVQRRHAVGHVVGGLDIAARRARSRPARRAATRRSRQTLRSARRPAPAASGR